MQSVNKPLNHCSKGIKKYFLFLMMLLPLQSLWAQESENLIPNPSFEEYECIPHRAGMPRCFKEWEVPTDDTPDYMHIEGVPPEEVYQSASAPDNWLGFQYPKTGDAYAALHTITYDPDNHEDLSDDQEYLRVKLKENLYVGQTYSFEFFISTGEYTRYRSNGFGLLFKKEVEEDMGNQIVETPSFYIEEIFTEEEEWVKIEGEFYADKAYEYLLIGRFLSNDDSSLKIIDLDSDGPNHIYGQASYFIDDIALYAHPVPEIDLGEDVTTCGRLI